MRRDLSGRYCIVGVGEVEPDPERALAAGEAESPHWRYYVTAARLAMQDAGVAKDEIDGVITSSSMVLHRRRHHVNLCEQLGIEMASFTEFSAMGGSSPSSNLRHAVAAIDSGMASMVLVAGCDNLLSGRGRQGAIEAGPAESHNAEFEVPYGPYMATLYGLFAQRWMHRYGWTSEQLAEVPVAMRRHASLHPYAKVRDPLITVDDVLASRPICSPFRLLDCSLFSDGGGAYLVTTVERARDLRKAPIHVLGVGGAYSYYYFEKWPDLVEFPRRLLGRAAGEAFAMAGLRPADMDLAGIADMFGVTVPIALECAGFCAEGEGAAFVGGGRIALGGDLPVNTHGGNLSYGLPGAGAQYPHLIEACRQLWGEAGPRQIPDATFAYLHNWSGNLSQNGAAVIGTEVP